MEVLSIYLGPDGVGYGDGNKKQEGGSLSPFI